MFFFYKMQQANNSQMSFGKNKAKKTLEERPDVTFADVAASMRPWRRCRHIQKTCPRETCQGNSRPGIIFCVPI